jgi:DNA-binding NarL/FixJ family response regulator
VPAARETVLVVDDDRRFRDLAKTVIERAGFAVVEAGSADQALAAARSQRPHLVLLDVKLPQSSGYGVYRELHDELGDNLPIIFVSGERTEPYDRVAGLLLGAEDYLVKPLDPDELVARIRRSLRPHRNGVHKEAERAPENGGGDLTPRELEVLRLVADGRSSAQIAHELVISPRTVGTHIQHILAKLGVANRTEAAAYAFRAGLIEMDVEGHVQAANSSPPPDLLAS